MSSDEITPLDFAILKYIGDKHRGAWKARIHEDVTEECQEYPFVTAVAAQTIGSHVDKLVDNGYLETAFVSPDDVDQSYVTGFIITEKGEDALDAARSRLLEDRIAPDIDESEPIDENEIGREALMNLMAEEFDIDEGSKSQELLENLDLEDILQLLALFYFHQKMHRNTADLSDATLEDMSDLVESAPELKEEFEKLCGYHQLKDSDPVVEATADD